MEYKLPNGQVVFIDSEDYHVMNAYIWRHLKSGRTTYVQAMIEGRTVLLHRLLLNAPKGTMVDHRNGDGLDNRRDNIRLCTCDENAKNRRRHKGTPVKRPAKGVELTPSNRFKVRFNNNKKRMCLGTFDTLSEAISAYNNASKTYHGDFASLSS